MSKITTLHPPVQPLREERVFLDYAEKPPLKPTSVFEGEEKSEKTYSISLEELPIKDIIPRENLENINFKSLQIWLDNLGPAIYNPLLVVQTPDGQFHSSRDGNHRSRCLWEIGEPMIRVVVRRASTTKMSDIKRGQWKKWLREYYKLNAHEPAMPYMFDLPRTKWKRVYRRYYPPLWQPPEVLQKYFNEPRNDGRFFKDTLFNTWSFRDIYSQWKQTGYRLDIIDAILKDTDIAGKTLLDVGPFYGWATFMLLEEGAKEATALELKKHRVDVIKHIALTRAYPVTTICDTIQNYEPNIEHFDVTLLLNVFHHILHQGEDAWDTLRSVISKSGKTYFMMGAKPQWGILDEWDNDVGLALASQLPKTYIEPLLKTTYRNRVLYVIHK